MKDLLVVMNVRYGKILRFIISGGSAAATNLIILYVCTHVFHIWYLASSVTAFVLSFFVSFTMQKFWTFGNDSLHMLPTQMAKYLFFILINLCANTLMMYGLVEYFSLHYLTAQIITMILLAFVSFFVYQHLVFNVPQENFTDKQTSEWHKFVPLIFLVLVAVFAAALPYITVRIKAGDAWQNVTPQLSYDSIRYFARTNDVVLRGNIYPNNPYLYEHRNEPSPTPSVNDALVGLPRFFGISFNAAYYINIGLWGFAYLILCLLLFRAIGISVWWAAVGSLWCYVGQYSDMLRPGAMQIVYPLYLLFLLCYTRALQHKRGSIVSLAIVTGLSAYSYIYLFMTALATLGISAFVFMVRKNWAIFRRMCAAIILGVSVSLPHYAYVMLLSGEPYYAETMRRFFLFATHWPQVELYYYGRWLLIGLVLTVLIARSTEKIRGSVVTTIIMLSGFGILAAMASNVVVGKDFDIAVHVARFGILWYLILCVMLFKPLRECVAPTNKGGSQEGSFLNRLREEFLRGSGLQRFLRVTALICFALLSYQMLMNLGRNTAVFEQQKEKVIEVQSFRGVLDWLDKQPEGVVIASGDLNSYIPMLTRQYTFFDPHAILFLASDEEMRERFLLAHAFDNITRDEFVARYSEYDGPTGEYLARVSALKHRACLLLRTQSNCPAAEPYTAYIDMQKITSKYDAYYPGLIGRIKEEYAKYHVRYVISRADVGPESQVREFCHETYRDQYFSVCVI